MMRSEEVDSATSERVDWYNHRRLGDAATTEPKMEFEHESSPLSVMGYKVGDEGGTKWRRQEILRRAIEEHWRPSVRRAIPSEQLEAWGPPGGARYRKILSKLQSQISNCSSRSDRYRYREAIREWERDLQWLRETFGETYSEFEVDDSVG